MQTVKNLFSKALFIIVFLHWNMSAPLFAQEVSLTEEERAWLAQNQTIRVSFWLHPPFFYIKDGKVVGIAVDFLNKIKEITGITFQYENRLDPFSDVLQGLKEHKGPDLVGALMPTLEREKDILFTEPYFSSPRFIFTRDDAPFVASIKDLFDRNIAVVKDYVIHNTLVEKYPNIDLLIRNNNEEALRAVTSGEAFAFIGDLVATPTMINEFGLKNLKASCPSGLPDHPLAMAIRGDWPVLRDIISRGLDAIPAYEKAAIMNRWSTVKVEHGIRSGDVLKWLLMGFSGVALILLAIFIWIRVLRREVKRRKAIVAQREEQLQNLIAQSPISIQIHEPDGRLRQTNAAYAKLWGLNQENLEELYKKYNLLQDEEAKRVGLMPLIEKLFSGEEIFLPLYEYDGISTLKNIGCKKPMARKSWVQTRGFPVKDKDGKILNVVLISEDITEKKRTEEKMDQLQGELLHTTRSMTMIELTAALAHELNHPLGSILNNANAAKRFLANKNPDLDEIREILSDIITEDRRASDVIQKLRALMKKTEIQFASLDINQVIEEVLLLTHSELVIKNISVTKQLEKKLPLINGDRTQLQQLLINVILNAIDAMEESKTRQITISTAQQRTENIIICVKDTGKGFEEKNKDNLFQPFFTTKKKGMGMGLSIIKTIIKYHAGNVWLENNKEGGTSFFLTLPINEKKSS